MHTVQIRVGRLYERRIESIASSLELEQIIDSGRNTRERAPGKIVVCADYRRLNFVPKDMTEKFGQFLSSTNPKVERSAILIAPNEIVVGLQMKRIVREAANPSRRIFQQAEPLKIWLGEVLTPDERARLDAFLAESSDP